MQFAYERISKHANVPIINLVEIVVSECEKVGYKNVAVLGVGLTLTDGLYDKQLSERSIEQTRLTKTEIKLLDSIIYDELVLGKILNESIIKILQMCVRLKRRGGEAIVLACTELQMVLSDKNSPLPIIDSTDLLARAAIEQAL